MDTVTSIHNERIKQARALYDRRERKERGLLLIEGPRFITEAIGAGAQVRECFFVDQSLSEPDQELLAKLEQAGAVCVPVTPQVLASLTETKTPQGIIAVAVSPKQIGEKVLIPGGFVIVVDEIRDPGNLGTILRTAAAVGAGVILLSGTTDPTSPKVIRGSAGACYAVPMWSGPTVDTVFKALQKKDYRTVVLDMNGPESLYDVSLDGSVAMVVGNEGHGPNMAWTTLGAELVHIPMPGRVESLNAGVAAAVVLYEALRQRTSHC